MKMKKTMSSMLAIIILIAACTKSEQKLNSQYVSDSKTDRIPPVATFLSACYDSINLSYHIVYELKNVLPTDAITGGTKIKHTEDTLSKHELLSVNGIAEFDASTGWFGSKAKPYIRIIGAKGADWNYYKDAKKIGCNQPITNSRPDTTVIKIDTTSMCFDGTFEHVTLEVSGFIKPNKDKLYVGALSLGGDTLSKVQLKTQTGIHQAQVTAGESGCGVKIYAFIEGPGGQKVSKQKVRAGCTTCTN